MTHSYNKMSVQIKKHLDVIEKKCIIDLHKRGYTNLSISDIYQIDLSTVKRIIRKYRSYNTVERKKGSGLTVKYDNIDEILS